MHFSELITARYSVRNFTNQHLDNAVVEQILKAGHLAPTGCNYQPYRVLVLNTDPAIEALKNVPNATLMRRRPFWSVIIGANAGPENTTDIPQVLLMRPSSLPL